MIANTSDCYQPIFLPMFDITFCITSDFSIYLMQIIAKVHLFVDKNIKCG